MHGGQASGNAGRLLWLPREQRPNQGRHVVGPLAHERLLFFTFTSTLSVAWAERKPTRPTLRTDTGTHRSAIDIPSGSRTRQARLWAACSATTHESSSSTMHHFGPCRAALPPSASCGCALTTARLPQVLAALCVLTMRSSLPLSPTFLTGSQGSLGLWTRLLSVPLRGDPPARKHTHDF